VITSEMVSILSVGLPALVSIHSEIPAGEGKPAPDGVRPDAGMTE